MHCEASTDDGGIVDGFGTFRRSPIFIFRYGPDFAAKFSAKYADGQITTMEEIFQILTFESLN